MTFQIRPLRKGDRREEFRCDQPDLDLFFHRLSRCLSPSDQSRKEPEESTANNRIPIMVIL